MLKIAVISNVTEFLDTAKPLLTKKGYVVDLFLLSQEDLHKSLIDRKTELIIIDCFTSPKTSQMLTDSLKENNATSGSYCIAVLDSSTDFDFDFKSGIDDFIFKDSFEREIDLRIGLFLWRCKKVDSKDRIVVSDFVVDNASYEVLFRGKKINLTFKEFELLKYLITNNGRVCSRDALLNQVWGYNYFGGTRTVDVHVRRLRAKIGLEIDNYLKTIRNVGYKFEG